MTSAWGITDGSAGMVAQVKALAAALGIVPEMKRVRIEPAWMPTFLYMFIRGNFLSKDGISRLLAKDSDPLVAPWPDLIIGCGRKAAIVALELQSYFKWRGELPPRFIHIGDPYVHPSHFDVVVAMEHDKITGPNVFKTRFALHQVTPAALALAGNTFASRFSGYAKPLVPVLIGGSTNKYTLRPEAMAQAIAALQNFLSHTPCSLLITPSRRTGAENTQLLSSSFGLTKGSHATDADPAIKSQDDGNKPVYIYDGKDENPYMGMLALADAIVVTDDSVNMMSEACATGKPVYLLHLPGHENTGPARFAQMLLREGIARSLGDTLESWSYNAPNEMEELAQEITKRLA